MMNNSVHDNLLTIYNAAVNAVKPDALIPKYITKETVAGYDKIYIAGAGKAVAAMAVEVEKIVRDKITDGFIAVKYGHSLPLKYTRQLEAAHPFPDTNSVMAANEMIKLFQKATANDLIIFLLSGGASSLLTDIPEGYTLDKLNAEFRLLINGGADIYEINAARKKLSGIKGGKLVKHANGAVILSLMISDVMGNDVAVIGSGPTAVNDPAVNNYIIGDNHTALKAAAKEGERLGYTVKIFNDFLQGDAEECARKWMQQITSDNNKNCCYIAGGETTVNVKGNGLGGRNQHFALAAAKLLQGHPELCLLAAGTDGTDGPTDATGAFADAAAWNNEAVAYLQNHDSYNFFKKQDRLLFTGPTQTNVMDIVITISKL